jgi:uncharacterized protein YecE (DUF72 family)
MIYVGTSGWVYDDWKGRFYPTDLKDPERLPFFSAHFPTVEINNSFYRLPTEVMFDSWRARSAPGFLFAVKASRFITHIKRLLDPKDPLELFWTRAKRLREKLGPVLFQLPPRFRMDVDRLAAFVENLPQDMRPAFEFRDATWNDDKVHDLLDRAGAALVMADRPRARVPDIVTGGWAYIRFHQGGITHPGYTRSKLARWADRIAAMPAKDVYVYFNNDTQGAAIRDAMTLTELLGARAVAIASPAA